jgi:phosphoglycolate phosphatase-like HAD superfamily hydrolase
MLQPQAQAQREPSRARAVESLTQQKQQSTIIDLTTSPSRDGTEGVGDSGMLIDVDENVGSQQVDENEDARTIEQGLDPLGEDNQAMDLVGDKSDDVDMGRVMQVDSMLFLYSLFLFYFS